MDDQNEDGWRIDDLARRSGATVDTIRFYQREGLLPPAERRGRSLAYGPEHLERLERIRDLQARHFTLKAIRALAEEGRLGLLDRLFGAEERALARPDLVAESGLDDDMVAELEAIGLLGPPELHGAIAYDGDDLAVLSSVRGSLERGMPRAVAVALARLYLGHMVSLQQQLFTTFAVGGTGLGPALSDEDLDAFRTLAANDIEAFLSDSCVMLEYLHRRGVQRLVVQALGWADSAGDTSLPSASF
ncbi:MAG: MerR family transcriptional regulator [Acidimicrobiales bacterium]